MSNLRIPQKQWNKIAAFLHQYPKVYVGDKKACRRFLSAVLWVTWSGAQWRFLPEKYSKWNSVYKRFSR